MTLLKKARYDAIVKEAMKLFLEKGIDGVTMADIASHLSIGEASLYRYFGKKQKIIIEVAIKIWEEIYEKLESVSIKSTGYENLESFYGFFLDIFEEHPEFYCFVEEFDLKVIQGSISSEELREYEQIILKFKDIYDGFFNMGQVDGTIKDNIDKDVFYYSTNHALLSLCKKLARKPKVLKYEQGIKEKEQIQCLIQICLQYIKGRETF